jgi:hypothetical protein
MSDQQKEHEQLKEQLSTFRKIGEIAMKSELEELELLRKENKELKKYIASLTGRLA